MQAATIPDKPPKPKRQRERDTTERDLNFDDLSQDHWMLMKLTDQAKTLKLIDDMLAAGNVQAARAMLHKAQDDNAAMIAREQEDLQRHYQRSAITDFKTREDARKAGSR